MNLFIITLDDVNFYNLGFTKYFNHYCSPTPNIDKLCEESYVFWNAHCNAPFCQPSRMVLLTGLYPQNNKSLGFNPIDKTISTLPLIFKKNNFNTEIIGKTGHHKPDCCFDWNKKQNYWHSNIIESISKSLKKYELNFFLINIENTHRPFYFDFTNGIAFEYKDIKDIKKIIEIKSKETKPKFLGNIPNTLPDTDLIRKDIFSFFKSLKKADEVIGDILTLTKENDVVVITSDHGFSFPYYKGNCYGASTNVPLIIRSNKILKKYDNDNLVSHIDFMPTILDLFNIEHNTKLDGKSYYKTLKGEKQSFDFVYSQLNKMGGGGPDCRIRAISNKEFTYCVNLDEYNADHVDGWGWHRILYEMKNTGNYYSWKNRRIEEFYKYSKMDMQQSDDIMTKENLKIKLLELMNKNNDPQIRNVEKKLKLLEKKSKIIKLI
jgi:N-sulfoglucosamine sulfohydrolase